VAQNNMDQPDSGRQHELLEIEREGYLRIKKRWNLFVHQPKKQKLSIEIEELMQLISLEDFTVLINYLFIVS
jgi:hypothetical protein